jgi:hypothetical protein
MAMAAMVIDYGMDVMDVCINIINDWNMGRLVKLFWFGSIMRERITRKWERDINRHSNIRIIDGD